MTSPGLAFRETNANLQMAEFQSYEIVNTGDQIRVC